MDDDPKTKKGLCLHLGVSGVRNKETGAVAVTGVAITGAHLAERPADAPTGAMEGPCASHASTGAVSDAYRVGWDRVFAQAPAPEAQPAVAAPTPAIAFVDLTEQVVSAPTGQN